MSEWVSRWFTELICDRVSKYASEWVSEWVREWVPHQVRTRLDACCPDCGRWDCRDSGCPAAVPRPWQLKCLIFIPFLKFLPCGIRDFLWSHGRIWHYARLIRKDTSTYSSVVLRYVAQWVHIQYSCSTCFRWTTGSFCQLQNFLGKKARV